MSPEWVESKYPKSKYESHVDFIELEGKSADDVRQAKQELERFLKVELAAQIFTSISSDVRTSTSQSDVWGSYGESQSGSSSFTEDVHVEVSSEFSTEKFETWQDKKILHGFVVIQKVETSKKLLKSSEVLFKQAISRAEQQIRSGNTLSLSEIEAERERGVRHIRTAIWLDDNAKTRQLEDLAAELAGLIERLKGSGSEEQFRRERANVAELIQKGSFEEADRLVKRLSIEYASREELEDLRKGLKREHRDHVERVCNRSRNSDSDSELGRCISTAQGYLRIYPTDEGMRSMMEDRQEDLFKLKIHELEVALDNDRLDLAEGFMSDIEGMPAFREDSGFKKLREKLVEKKVERLLSSVELKESAGKPHDAWKEINDALNRNHKLYENAKVMKKREEIGKQCAEADIQQERDKAHYRLALLAGLDFRTNGALWSDVLNESNFDLYGGVQAYSLGIYKRKVLKPDVVEFEGKKKDQSSGFHLSGLKATLLQYDTYRHWADSTAEAYLPIQGETLNVSLDFVSYNFLHYAVGAETSWPSDLANAQWNYTVAVGLQLCKKLRRGMIAVRGDVVTRTDLQSPPIMHLQTGLSWVPYFFTKVDNKDYFYSKY